MKIERVNSHKTNVGNFLKEKQQWIIKGVGVAIATSGFGSEGNCLTQLPPTKKILIVNIG